MLRVQIDRSRCIGAGNCINLAPTAFEWLRGEHSKADLADTGSVEEELLARIALMSEYHRGPEQRRAIAAVLKKFVLPPEPEAAPAPASPVATGPVPYNADGHFELGQRLTHKKFGEVAVTSVGETWIEVELPDGTKKRLAHKP